GLRDAPAKKLPSACFRCGPCRSSSSFPLARWPCPPYIGNRRQPLQSRPNGAPALLVAKRLYAHNCPMKLDSPWFDRIRAAKKPGPAEAAARHGGCQHPGCAEKGEFRAPKGRNREGEYFHFCFDHVRQYNQSYNYFRDMPDEAVRAWEKDNLTGHRPTWTMGVNKAAGASSRPHSAHPRYANWDFADPYNLFGGDGGQERP